jgi:hypothetical protein
MQRVFEKWDIESVLQADTVCTAKDLDVSWQGVVVEVQDAEETLQGVLVYFPGVSWKELKKRPKAVVDLIAGGQGG